MIVEIPQVPLLDRFLDMPVSVRRWCTVPGRQGRRHFCRGAEAVSLGPSVQKSIEILQLQFIDKVFDVCCAGPAGSSGAVGEETVEIPQLQLAAAWTLSLTCPSLCNDRWLVVQSSENCEGPAVAVHERG